MTTAPVEPKDTTLAQPSLEETARKLSEDVKAIPGGNLLKGKNIVVSGGSRGLGQAICAVFAREGANIAFNYASNDVGAQLTKELIEEHGQTAHVYKVDITERDKVREMGKTIIEDFGQVHGLVNNAAMNRGDNFATMSEQAWLDVININVNGLYYMTKPFFKHMMRNRAGAILNISSIAGIRAVPTSVHYSTAKAATIGFTKCLSREAAPFGISVNAIASGILDTDLGNALPAQFLTLYQSWCSKGRLGTAQDVAEFCAFMVSDRNRYMTGEVITVDGGTVV